MRTGQGGGRAGPVPVEAPIQAMGNGGAKLPRQCGVLRVWGCLGPSHTSLPPHMCLHPNICVSPSLPFTTNSCITPVVATSQDNSPQRAYPAS